MEKSSIYRIWNKDNNLNKIGNDKAQQDPIRIQFLPQAGNLDFLSNFSFISLD